MSKEAFYFLISFVLLAFNCSNAQNQNDNKLKLKIINSCDNKFLILEMKNTSNHEIVLYGYDPSSWTNFHLFKDSSITGIFIYFADSTGELIGKRPSIVFPADDPINDESGDIAKQIKKSDKKNDTELKREILNEIVKKAGAKCQKNHLIVPANKSIYSVVTLDWLASDIGDTTVKVYYRMNQKYINLIGANNLNQNIFIGLVQSNIINLK